jgi:addiction module HigA family antidote
MRLIHPGEVLCEELLVPFGLSVDALAMAVQVPAPRINGIVRERRAVPADTALRPAKLFGASAESWLGLQSDYDAALARVPLRDVLKRIQSFEPATG